MGEKDPGGKVVKVSPVESIEFDFDPEEEEEETGEKYCPTCEKVKPLQQFYKRSDREGRAFWQCKACKRAYENKRRWEMMGYQIRRRGTIDWCRM